MQFPFNIFSQKKDTKENNLSSESPIKSADLTSADSTIMGYTDSTGFFYPSSSMWTMVGIPTVLQCVTILANGISQVPFKLYQREDKVSHEAKEHSLHKLLSYKPNNYQSSYEFMDNIGLRLALQGEVVVWIVRIGNKVRQLIPFGIDKVYINEKFDNAGFPVKEYHLMKPNGTIVVVPEKDIWHVRRRTFAVNHNIPYSALISKTLELAVSETNFLGSSYKNGARPSGLVTAKSALKQDQIEIIQKGWQAAYGGSENAHKTIFLGADLEYKPMSFSNADSQQLENRQHMISEICRMFNVSPFMVFEYTNNSSYSSSEQMLIQHLVHTLAPIYKMVESGFMRYVMTEDEVLNKGYYVKFKEDALMRLDQKTKAEVSQTEVNTGIRTINEERALRELPPIEGGDNAIVQGAMIPLKDAGMPYQNSNNQSSESSKEAESDTAPSNSNEITEGVENADK